MLAFIRPTANDERAPFDPRALRIDDAPPSPLPRRLLQCLLALLTIVGIALAAGRLDIVAVAEGRLVPRTLVKIVQPADGGVLREILVEEGDAVVAGQVLVRLDARIADADVRAHRSELVTRMLQARRIDAELAERPLERATDDPDDAFERTAAQYRANRDAQQDAIGQATAQVVRIGRELAAAQAVREKLERTVPIAQTMAARYDRLRAEGFVSELFALERERERIEREHDLHAQRESVRALEASLVHAERQLAQQRSTYRRQLELERADTAAQLARLREELDKLLVRRERVELVAPQAGIVKELATRTLGAVVGSGTVLITLVPAGEALEAEVLIRNDDAGFVRAGQRAQLKIGAYPFQKYGLVEAEVLRVGADASEPAGQPAADTPAGAYRARLALASQSVLFDGARLALVSGMVVHAEIHLGRRPVIDYLLAPVQKAWHEAARER
jgi:HlyD family secretion protein